MFKRFARRPSPATVIASVALFVSLGGVGYAAATIGSAQIKNNSVRSKDIKNNDVRGGDIRTGTVKGSDVGANTLTGGDISESSLGKVPSAATADKAGAAAFAANATNATNAVNATNAGNANTVGGIGMKRFRYAAAVNTAEQTVLSYKGLVMRATCDAGGDLDGEVESTRDNALLFFAGHAAATTPWLNSSGNSDADPGQVFNLFDDDAEGFVMGFVNYSTADGTQVNVQYNAHDGFNEQGAVCIISGIATG